MNTLNSMHSAISMEDIQQTHNDDTLTFNNDTNETIIDGSCTDLRNSKRSSRSASKCGTIFSLYFRDEIRTIDFVLVWDEYNVEAQTYRCTEYRRIFEKNLEKEGLQLEYEQAEPNGLHFIKIHAPKEVLRR